MNGKISAGDCVKVSVEVPKYTIEARKREIEDLLTKNPVHDGQKELNDRYVFRYFCTFEGPINYSEYTNQLNTLIGFIIVFLVTPQKSAMITRVGSIKASSSDGEMFYVITFPKSSFQYLLFGD